MLTKVVVRSLPLKRTTAPLTRFAPLTVSVNAPVPTIPTAGERLPITGTGLKTASVAGAELPPPGAGWETVIGNVPVAVISDARVTAVNRVAAAEGSAPAQPLSVTKKHPFKMGSVCFIRNSTGHNN